MRLFLKALISIVLVILLCSGVEGNPNKEENKNKSKKPEFFIMPINFNYNLFHNTQMLIEVHS